MPSRRGVVTVNLARFADARGDISERQAELAATEIVRRAERGLGLCIRKGQAEGRIVRRGSSTRTDLNPDLVGVNNYVDKSEFYGNGTTGQPGLRHLTDDVSDEDFETALTEAKAEGTILRRREPAHHQGRTTDTAVPPKSSPANYASFGELTGSGKTAGIYHLTDGVTDEDFEHEIDCAAVSVELERWLRGAA